MKKLRYLVLFVTVALPAYASAQLPRPQVAPEKIESQSGFDTLDQPVSAAFDILIFFLPTVAMIYLIFSGYRYIIAQGNQELVEKAKKSLIYAVFGFLAALVSVALIVVISQALGFDSGLGIK